MASASDALLGGAHGNEIAAALRSSRGRAEKVEAADGMPTRILPVRADAVGACAPRFLPPRLRSFAAYAIFAPTRRPGVYALGSAAPISAMLLASVRPDHRTPLLNVAVSTGLFSPEEAELLLGGVLDALASGSLPPGHEAACALATPSGPTLGWSYFAPDDHAEGVWNLWWIGVRPEHHGIGVGAALLEYFEHRAAAQGGRVLVVEISDGALLTRARQFYAARGYAECGRVPHFYAPGEAKVIFSRSLLEAA